MNIIKKWKEKRAARKREEQLAAQKQEADENQERIGRKEILEKYAQDFKVACADSGFRFLGWRTFQEDYTITTLRAMTPRGDIIVITITHKGGVYIKQIT